MRSRPAWIALFASIAMTSSAGLAQEGIDVATTLYRAGDALGMLRTPREVDRIATMIFEGTGTMIVDGEPCSLEHYRAGVRYPIPEAAHSFPVPGLRVDYGCARSDGDPVRHIEVVAGEFAWNETAPGIGASAAPDTLRERLLRVWTLPQGLIKAAHLAGDRLSGSMRTGRPVLSFPLPEPLADTIVEVTFDPAVFLSHTMPNGTVREFTHRIERVRTELDGSTIEIQYADYRDWNEADYKADVLLPGRTRIERDGERVLDLTLSSSNTYNPYVVMPVPAALAQ